MIPIPNGHKYIHVPTFARPYINADSYTHTLINMSTHTHTLSTGLKQRPCCMNYTHQSTHPAVLTFMNVFILMRRCINKGPVPVNSTKRLSTPDCGHRKCRGTHAVLWRPKCPAMSSDECTEMNFRCPPCSAPHEARTNRGIVRALNASLQIKGRESFQVNQ